MKSSNMIAEMAINEVRAFHKMYEALIHRGYKHGDIMNEICMSMNNDIIEVIYNIKSPDVEFDMCKYHGRFDNLLYSVDDILMLASYLEREDVEEIIGNVQKQFIRSLDKLFEEYTPAK